MQFTDSDGKPHEMTIFSISPVSEQGTIMVRYRYDSELLSHEIKVANATGGASQSIPMAESGNPLHVAAPFERRFVGRVRQARRSGQSRSGTL